MLALFLNRFCSATKPCRKELAPNEALRPTAPEGLVSAKSGHIANRQKAVVQQLRPILKGPVSFSLAT